MSLTASSEASTCATMSGLIDPIGSALALRRAIGMACVVADDSTCH